MCAVGGLALSDSSLLSRLRRPMTPLLLRTESAAQRREVVHVALREDVAAARELAILGADQRHAGALLALGVLGAVDEAGEIAGVEVAEAVHLVHHLDRVAELRADPQRQLEVEVGPLRDDVQQQIAAGAGAHAVRRPRAAEARRPAGRRRARRRPRAPGRSDRGHERAAGSAAATFAASAGTPAARAARASRAPRGRDARSTRNSALDVGSGRMPACGSGVATRAFLCRRR